VPAKVQVGFHGIHGCLDGRELVQRSRHAAIGIAHPVQRRDRERLFARPVDPNPQVVPVVAGRFRGRSDQSHEVCDRAFGGGGLGLPTTGGRIAAHRMPADRGREGHGAIVVDADPRLLPHPTLTRCRVRSDPPAKTSPGIEPVHVRQWMNPIPRIRQREAHGGLQQQHPGTVASQLLPEVGDARVGDRDQPRALFGVADVEYGSAVVLELLTPGEPFCEELLRAWPTRPYPESASSAAETPATSPTEMSPDCAARPCCTLPRRSGPVVRTAARRQRRSAGRLSRKLCAARTVTLPSGLAVVHGGWSWFTAD
jgi:hypothetical protein